MEKVKLVLVGVFLIAMFAGCISEKTENISKKGKMRIEFSNCYVCGACVSEFKCPTGAIETDSDRTKYQINVAKCINCGLCKTEFKCPANAFTQEADTKSPGIVKNFKISEVYDDGVAVTWDEGTDDGEYGVAYKYVIMVSKSEIIDENSEDVEGVWEILWYADEMKHGIKELTPGVLYYIGIKALDEEGNSSIVSFVTVKI